MRKYILLGLLIGIMPNLCLGASIRYSQLIKEKQRKIEELEKCTGSTGKLKIAGISTLGLTAAGVAGNVVEAQKIKEYGKESEKLDKKLETARTEKAAEESLHEAAVRRLHEGQILVVHHDLLVPLSIWRPDEEQRDVLLFPSLDWRQ